MNPYITQHTVQARIEDLQRHATRRRVASDAAPASPALSRLRLRFGGGQLAPRSLRVRPA